MRNRETDSVGWLRWNTGRVSSKETTCRSRGRQKGRRKEEHRAWEDERERESVAWDISVRLEAGTVVWVTVVGLRRGAVVKESLTYLPPS